jgi:hypothetical protein
LEFFIQSWSTNSHYLEFRPHLRSLSAGDSSPGYRYDSSRDDGLFDALFLAGQHSCTAKSRRTRGDSLSGQCSSRSVRGSQASLHLCNYLCRAKRLKRPNGLIFWPCWKKPNGNSLARMERLHASVSTAPHSNSELKSSASYVRCNRIPHRFDLIPTKRDSRHDYWTGTNTDHMLNRMDHL